MHRTGSCTARRSRVHRDKGLCNRCAYIPQSSLHFARRQFVNKCTDISEYVYTGGDAALADALWRSMINAGVHSGVLYIASATVSEPEIRPDAIHAIGLWFPPGQLLYST